MFSDSTVRTHYTFPAPVFGRGFRPAPDGIMKTNVTMALSGIMTKEYIRQNILRHSQGAKGPMRAARVLKRRLRFHSFVRYV